MTKQTIITAFAALSLLSCNSLKQEHPIITKEYSLEFNDFQTYLEQIKNYIKTNDSDVFAHRSYQDVELELGNYGTLKADYSNRLNENSASALYNYLYGRLEYYASNNASAICYFKKAILLDPKFPWGYNALANMLFAENKSSEARMMLERCIHECPDFIHSYISLSKIILNKEGPKKTIDYLLGALRKLKTDYDISIELVDLYTFIHSDKSAKRILNKMLDTFRNDYRYHHILFKLAAVTQSLRKKEKILNIYWAKYPDSDNIISVYNQLYELYKNQNLNEAIEFARSALVYKTKIKRLKSIAYSNLIDIYRNRSDMLFELSKEMVNSDMNNSNTLNRMGELMLEKGREDIAISLFNKAKDSCTWSDLKNNVVFGPIINERSKEEIITLHTNISILNLGKAYFNKKEYAKALEYFEQVIETNNVLNEDSYLYAGRCYYELNNKNEAENVLEYAYRRYGSKKALDILVSIKPGDSKMPINKVTLSYKKLDGVALLSGYRGKFIVLGLFETSCSPCLFALDMLSRIANKYINDNRIAFINLFYENEENIVNRNIMVNREAYYEIVNKLNISNVPWILFMDKDLNIMFEKIGIKDKEDNMKDIDFKIAMLMGR